MPLNPDQLIGVDSANGHKASVELSNDFDLTDKTLSIDVNGDALCFMRRYVLLMCR